MLNNPRPIDPIIHAIADPARRGIVEELTKGPRAVGKLAEGLPMSLPAVMQHIAVLEAAGIVTSRKAGRVRTVSLEPSPLRALEGWAAELRMEWERRLDRLGAFLDETRPDREELP
jgi:DNA-binding transcriptional ArsR family regulator